MYDPDALPYLLSVGQLSSYMKQRVQYCPPCTQMHSQRTGPKAMQFVSSFSGLAPSPTSLLCWRSAEYSIKLSHGLKPNEFSSCIATNTSQGPWCQ